MVGLSAGDALTVLEGRGLTPKVVRRKQPGFGLRRIVSQQGLRIVVGGRSTP